MAMCRLPLRISDSLYTAQLLGSPVVVLGEADRRFFPAQRLGSAQINIVPPRKIEGKVFTESQIEGLQDSPSLSDQRILSPFVSGRVVYPGTSSIGSEFYAFSPPQAINEELPKTINRELFSEMAVVNGA